MNLQELKEAREKCVLKMYNALADGIKEDVVEASIWARNTLTDHEGSGHIFNVYPEKDGVVCCFSKPEWNADHCSKVMDSASEAIVRAVCEYLSGA